MDRVEYPSGGWVPSDDIWRRFIESVEDVAIILLDRDGTIMAWNRGAEQLKGYTAEEAIGQSFSMFYPEDAVAAGHPFRELEAAAAIGRYREEGWRLRKGGERFWADVTITAIYDASGEIEGFGKLTRDLTLAKQAEEQRARTFALLETTAAIDALTGLANRRAWDEAINREVLRAGRELTPLCIAVIDLDHFKAFNDEHGHRAGDHFLRRCAVRWRSTLRASDTLARYGGEEFGLCLPACSLTEATTVVDRLRELTPDGQTCSVGLASLEWGESIDQLFGRADQALYRAKKLGRNRTALALSLDPVIGEHPAADLD